MRPQNRKINSKGRPVRTKIQLRLFKQKAYRFGTVAFPVAISHKVSVDTKTLRFFNPDAKKLYKNEPKHGPKNGTAWRSHFWDRMAVPFLGPHAQLSKRTKGKHFHGPIFGTVWRNQK